ncbi:MAG: DUF2490 domain-containing protein [Crocinitomicaceae bacterium]
MFSKILFRFSFLIAFLVNFQNTTIAQDNSTIVTQDLETWSKIGLKYKLNKKWSFGLDQQLRLKQNSNQVNQIITDLHIKYKFDFGFYLGTAFRYIADQSNDLTFDNDFRFNIDAGYKHKIDRLSFNYRLRYQNKNEIGLNQEEGDDIDKVIRLKVGVKYNIKNWKIDPNFSTEIFSDLTQSTDRFEKMRFTLGSDYSFNKRNEIGFFYRIEKELNASYPKTTYIIGLNYTHTLKLKR